MCLSNRVILIYIIFVILIYNCHNYIFLYLCNCRNIITYILLLSLYIIIIIHNETTIIIIIIYILVL
jgi:hypothetical protein